MGLQLCSALHKDSRHARTKGDGICFLLKLLIFFFLDHSLIVMIFELLKKMLAFSFLFFESLKI